MESKMIDLKDARSLAEFKDNAEDYVKRMKETRTPLVLTVDGKAELVVQDAETYQRILERIDYAEAVAGIKKGLEEFVRGEGRPAREALEELRQKHEIPR